MSRSTRGGWEAERSIRAHRQPSTLDDFVQPRHNGRRFHVREPPDLLARRVDHRGEAYGRLIQQDCGHFLNLQRANTAGHHCERSTVEVILDASQIGGIEWAEPIVWNLR